MRHFLLHLLSFPYSVSCAGDLPSVDIVGVGLNATDTMIRLPHFPAFNSKVEFRVSEVLPGRPGRQRCDGLRAVGAHGALRRKNRRRFVPDILQQAKWKGRGRSPLDRGPDCQSQSSFILVDEEYRGTHGPLEARSSPGATTLGDPKGVGAQARLLHVDGHDCAAATAAARWAREASIPVTADLDNLYPGVEALLENVDYAITSREFPARLCGEEICSFPFRDGYPIWVPRDGGDSGRRMACWPGTARRSITRPHLT